jgi:biopolymer transport protein ExbD
MRFITLKNAIWISILSCAGLAIYLVTSFVSRTMHQDISIDSPLTLVEAQTEIPGCRCDPIVFAIDANGNVYCGKNVIGNLACTLVLTREIREVIKSRASRLAYAAGMDLSLEVPLRCASEPVYIKTDSHADNSRTLELIRALRDVGIHPTWLFTRGKSREVNQ